MRAWLRVLIVLAVVVATAAAAYVGVERMDRGGDSGPSRTAPGPVSSTEAVPSTSAPATERSGTGLTVLEGAPLPLSPAPATIAWTGDSVADTLAAAVAGAAMPRGVRVINRSTSGCGMVRGQPTDENLNPLTMVSACDASILPHHRALAAERPDVVTWLSTWETADRIVDGQTYRFGTPEGDAKLLALIDESAQVLTANGARLVFLTVAPNAPAPRRPVSSDEDAQRAVHLDELLRQYAATHADRVSVLDLASIVCPSGHPCPQEVDGVTLRPDDGGHFGPEGAAWVAPRIVGQLLGP